MMRVLHIYPKEEPQIELYVSMLKEALTGSAELMSTNDAAEASRFCESFRPDIVHRHGRVCFKRPKGYVRQVLTPHGQLPTMYQPVFVYIARSQMEAKRIQASAELHNGNPQPYVETVLNPLITKSTSADELGKNMLRIYRKTLDSQPLELMNVATKQMLGALLKVGICGDKRWITSLPHLEEVDYRQIFIYAQYENVTHLIKRGLQALEINFSSSDEMAIAKVDTPYNIYLPKQYAQPQPMVGRSIEEQLLDIQKNGLSLIRMTDLASVLFKDDIEEDKLMEKLKNEKLNTLLSCILQIMKETFAWDVGYMPCEPTDNHETHLLRKQIDNHLKL